jgi:hypothetical protein
VLARGVVRGGVEPLLRLVVVRPGLDDRGYGLDERLDRVQAKWLPDLHAVTMRLSAAPSIVPSG